MIRAILADNWNSRSFIVRRGANNCYIRALLDGFFVLSDGCEADHICDVMKTIRKYDLPEHLVIELMAASYRMKLSELFKSCESILSKEGDSLEDKEVVPGILHEMAAWAGEIDKDSDRAIEYNKRALGLARSGGYKIIELKILFGLSYNKSRRDTRPLSQKERVEDFRSYKEGFRKLGDNYDALRAETEEARAMFNYAKGQDGEIVRALELAKNAHNESRRIGYTNALIQAKELLAEIYDYLNKKNAADRFRKEADNLRINFSYEAPPLDKK